MNPKQTPASHHRPWSHRGHAGGPVGRFLKRWFWANSLVAGVLGLAWLILRSGSKPSRFAYPCQQAALSAATLAFGTPFVGALLAARRQVAAGLRSRAGLAACAGGLLVAAGMWGYLAYANAYHGPVLDPPREYRATLYRVTECPEDPIGDRFVGVDNLLALMGREGLKFHRSTGVSLTSGPEGILAADDTVVIKINYQWPERGGSNTDVLRGLILRILDHPDGFSGEVVVCENAQFNPIDGFDRSENNAQDHSLSPHDVVAGFQGQGHPVSHRDWTVLRYKQVDEYDQGDTASGYVVGDYDPEVHGKVSYPKFDTDYGTLISLKHGLWDAGSQSYDREHLRFINLPVLKSHHATYGATVCVKHYMGVVTKELGTNSHNAIRYGILGALQGEIRPADLNLLDCIWINANPYDGPWTTYEGATRRDQLVAGVDPVAIDLWAVKNILIPAFLEGGYTPPWPEPSADPDDPGSDFREYLDNSMYQLLDAGYEVTNDLERIDALTWNGSGDGDGDSDVDLADHAALHDCLNGPGLSAPAGCERLDFDGDSDVDLADFAGLQGSFTGPGSF